MKLKAKYPCGFSYEIEEESSITGLKGVDSLKLVSKCPIHSDDMKKCTQYPSFDSSQWNLEKK